MYNLSDLDTYVIRTESKFIFFFTFFFFIYFDNNNLALIYGIWAGTLVCGTEDEDDEVLTDSLLWEEMELHASLRPFEEREGSVLLEWDFDELLDNISEIPNLPKNYPLIDSFIDSLNTIPHNRYNINLTDSEILNNDESRKSLNKYKLNLTTEYRKAYLSNYRKKVTKDAEIVKYRLRANFLNDYLSETELRRGLYSNLKYDFELFSSNNINLYCLFLEYSLIIDQSFDNTTLSLVNYDLKHNINMVLDLINERTLLTSDQLLENIERIKNLEQHNKNNDL